MVDMVRRHWLFLLPLVVFAGYYLFQNFIGFTKYPSKLIVTMLVALFLSAVSYILAYRFLPVTWADKIANKLPAVRNPNRAMVVVVLGYLVVIIFACVSADKVPIVEAVLGASADQLAGYRNTFMRGQGSNGNLVNYGFAIFTQALMPLAIAYAFWTRQKWRYLVLAVFVIATSLSLSKGAFLCVTAPLIAVFLMQGRWKAAICAVFGFVASVAVMYVLASGMVGAWHAKFEQRQAAERLAEQEAEQQALQASQAELNQVESSKAEPLKNDSPKNAPHEIIAKAAQPTTDRKAVSVKPVEPKVVDVPEVAPQQVALQSDIPDQYNLFKEKTQTLLIINRIVWIPYVTAVDWFLYQETRLNGEYVLGRSIRPLAYLMGADRLYLEKEVADLQWGGGASGSTSNAVFFADAWLNWGPLGVIIYSIIFALTIKLIVTSGNPPLVAASGFPVWVACFSALPPVYFSAGLGFLLIVALFSRKKRPELQSQ